MELDRNKTPQKSHLNTEKKLEQFSYDKKQQYPPILAQMSDCYFFTSYNFSLTLFFPPSTKDLLKWSIIELPLLPDMIRFRVKPHFLKPFPKSPTQAQILQ